MALGTPIKCGSHGMPTLWQYILPADFLEISFPDERQSTCTNCPKIVSENFGSVYRCCTFEPRISNFSVGFIIRHGGEGARRILDLIALGHATPEGITQSPRQLVASLEVGESGTFGKNDSVLCPFLDKESKGCTIYSFRNGVCSTYFCMNDHGKTGNVFWENVQNYVCQVESVLSQWCIEQAGVNISDFMERWNSLKDEVDSLLNLEHRALPFKVRKLLWGVWYGREREFFELCADMVWKRRGELMKIAGEFKPQNPVEFAAALAEKLPQKYHSTLEELGLLPGNPVGTDDLLYQARLSHRAMMQLPTSDSVVTMKPPTKIENNLMQSPIERYFMAMPKVIHYELNERQVSLYITEAQANALAVLSVPTHLTSDFYSTIFKFGIADPRKQISEWLRVGILSEG